MSTPAETIAAELERFRARCFWWVRADLPLIEVRRETLIRGLQTHGGWEGMQLAGRLQRLCR